MEKEVYAIVRNEKEGEGKSDVEFWKDEIEKESYDVWGEEKRIEENR